MVVSDPDLDEREAKFLPDAAAARAFWAVASRHLDVPREAAPFAYSRTTYYDTAELAYYRSAGSRLRVREYAAAATPDELPIGGARCYLELKHSAGGRRAKLRVALRPDEVAAALTALDEAPLSPYVATWYQRRALVDGTGALRVTLDQQVRLCRPRPLGSAFAHLEREDVVGEGPAFVLEYKARLAPPPGPRAAPAGPEEAVGFSKFLLGMDAVVRPPTMLRAVRGLDRLHLQVA